MTDTLTSATDKPMPLYRGQLERPNRTDYPRFVTGFLLADVTRFLLAVVDFLLAAVTRFFVEGLARFLVVDLTALAARSGVTSPARNSPV